MRSGILIFGLLLSCAANTAAWKPLAEGRGVTYFVDPDSRVQNGGIATMLVLSNFEKPKQHHQQTYRSMVEFWRADCAGEKVALIEALAMTGDMGAGAIVFDEAVNSPWMTPKANKIAADLLRAACTN